MMADTRTQGLHEAQLASTAAMSDQGFSLADDALRIDCSSRCLEPGTQVRVNLEWQVDLPWLPPPLAGRVEGFPISAEQILIIDRYRDSAA